MLQQCRWLDTIGGGSSSGGTSGQENLPNSQNWYVGTWQSANLEVDGKTFSQKLEIVSDGSWKLWIRDTSDGKIYDWFASVDSLVESTTGYSAKGTYEVKTDTFSWGYDDGSDETFSGGIYLKTDPRIGDDGYPTTRFRESRFFYDDATGKAFFLTYTKGEKDSWTKVK